MGSHIGKTFFVAFTLCLVCSVVVSTTAVSLKERQQVNAALDMKKNVLSAGGLLKAGAKADEINQVFDKFETVIVNLKTGELVEDVDPQTFDQRAAQKKPNLSVSIPAELDLAGLNRRAKYGKVFVYKDEEGEPQIYIFHITSKGLWSTMFGFMALESDLSTVRGFGYYSQAETPGLGGEVDNPKWKGQWVGKSVYNEDEIVALKLAKGPAPKEGRLAEYRVDGLSGATITADGVSSSIKYFFSDHGYKKFIDRVKSGEVTI